MKILAITVGGSRGPIIRSIEDHSPDHVVFFVTTEPHGGSKLLVLEKTSGEESIVSATGLTKEKFQLVEIPYPDNLADTYVRIRDVLAHLDKAHLEAQKIADYTGGTKTMSVSLALAALRLGWTLSLVAGLRPDTNKVRNGTESVQIMELAPLKVEEAMEKASRLFDLRDYEAAEDLLAGVVREVGLSGEKQKQLQRAIAITRAFALWDKFQHSRALEVLEPCAKLCPQNVAFLRALVQGKPTAYVKVWDLLRNAERRAEQGKYDDAVMRLYRAIELLAQIRLQDAYNLHTGNITLEKLPEPIRSEFDKRKAMLDKQGRKLTAGLVDSYRILASYGDPLGKLYAEKWHAKIQDLLGMRNSSILAHGTEPIGKEKWSRAYSLANSFLEEAAEVLKLKISAPQFPRWKEVMG
ncbi:TIGR02710 family CRISPR-associated CARF protein [Candidatus Bipolaricaulota sp. J31]